MTGIDNPHVQRPDVEIDFEALTTVAACDEIINLLSEKIISLKSQIDHAQADIEEGLNVDRHWLAKVNHARRHSDKDRTRVNNLRTELVRAAKAEKHAKYLEESRLRHEARDMRQASRDRALLDFIKQNDPEAFYRAVDALRAEGVIR